MLTIGQKIKAKRMELGITQRDLALRMGWKVPVEESQGSPRISHYENGTRSPRTKDLNALAEALGVTVPWLISDQEEGAKETGTILNFAAATGSGKTNAYAAIVEEMATKHREAVQLPSLSDSGEYTFGKASFYLSRSWIDDNGFKLSKLRTHFVRDRSQEPLAAAGDNLIVDTTDKQAKDRKIYVVQYAKQIKIRTLKTTLEGNITLIDAEGDEEKVTQDTWNNCVIGRVVARFGLM